MEAVHSHVFLGTAHEANERRSWAVIALCGVMMATEVVGGLSFHSIALVADGLHMSTHAGALLLAAMAYSYARRYSEDPRFTFGTGKLGDLAGFSSAIVLLMIAMLIGYEAVSRLIAPVPIRFREAIPIACLGLVVNLASVWLLGGGLEHGHGHTHRNGHRPHGDHHDHDGGHDHDHDRGHELGGHDHHHHAADHHRAHAAAHRDNNMRAAIVHVLADATVSLLVMLGLSLAWMFGWLWMDPLAGMIGAVVIVSWSWSLIRDTGAVLLDMAPDRHTVQRIRRLVESAGDRLNDLHVWRLGPGHLGVILSVATEAPHDAAFYRAQLAEVPALSHVTIEVEQNAKAG
ncbi:MAG TPA: CDF family Co(II)/Ni(II) efflux transporter DmeF [Acetobacteraceae bacterium]|nr:CDF family Co(II)/Ni(II) efflux transporter DmeF [Acetobacteraceae bacterium]